MHKSMIASDLHGDADACRAMLSAYERSGAEELILLGDLLYHGPRNDLPAGYAPKEVIALLSAMKKPPICVRGNCDAEVDQMVLPFPIMADYALLQMGGRRVYATHGHHASPDNLPALAAGDAFLYGHTHILQAEMNADGILLLNPGSVSLPKGGNPKTYMLYADGHFTVYDFAGNALTTV